MTIDPLESHPVIPPPSGVAADPEKIAEAIRDAREAPDDPHRLARLFVRRCEGEGRPIIWHRQEWLRWSAGAYRPVEDSETRAGLTRLAKAEFDRVVVTGSAVQARRVTSRLTGDVRNALASEVLVEGAVEPPAWLDGRASPDPLGLIVCRNGSVNLDRWSQGLECLTPPTPALYTTTALPFDFDPAAPPPWRWLDFLAQLWRDDPQAVELLQEWFGYCLTQDTSQQKILLLVGPRRCGKGTIGRVLTRLIGPANVCNPTLSSLGGEFGLQPLLGKTLALISDARLSGRADAVSVTERLLSISGEDGQTVNRKHLSQVSGRLPVRLALLTNELPRLTDASSALAGRMLLLRLTQSWYGKEDPALTDRLLGDLPGILLWAMEGWKRLRDRGRFVTPDSSDDLQQDLDDLVSPIGIFIRMCCVVEPNAAVPRGELYRCYQAWCEQVGHEPQSDQVFGRDLRAAVPSLGTDQPRVNGRQVRRYVGIRLRVPADGDSDTGDACTDLLHALRETGKEEQAQVSRNGVVHASPVSAGDDAVLPAEFEHPFN